MKTIKVKTPPPKPRVRTFQGMAIISVVSIINSKRKGKRFVILRDASLPVAKYQVKRITVERKLSKTQPKYLSYKYYSADSAYRAILKYTEV